MATSSKSDSVVINALLTLCQSILCQMGYSYGLFSMKKWTKLCTILLSLLIQTIISYRALAHEDCYSTIINILGTVQIFSTALYSHWDLTEQWDCQAQQYAQQSGDALPVYSNTWKTPWGVRSMMYFFVIAFCCVMVLFGESILIFNALAYFIALSDGVLNILVELFDGTIKQ